MFNFKVMNLKIRNYKYFPEFFSHFRRIYFTIQRGILSVELCASGHEERRVRALGTGFLTLEH